MLAHDAPGEQYVALICVLEFSWLVRSYEKLAAFASG